MLFQLGEKDLQRAMSGPGNRGEGSSAATNPSSSTSTTANTTTTTNTSGYTLPVGPLISRNLSYVLNLPYLPPLPQIRSLLISSEPDAANGRSEGSQVRLQDRIAALTSTQEKREALIELKQALALSVSSAKDELPSSTASSSSSSLQGEEEDTASWTTLEESLAHRLLLASCYVLSTPPHLHEAKHELEVARAALRTWVSPPTLSMTGTAAGAGANASAVGAATTKERRAARVQRSRAWSGNLLLALANVVEMQGGSREEVRRLMGWREKALNAK